MLIMDTQCELRESHTSDVNVRTELWVGSGVSVVRVIDLDANKVVGITKYPNTIKGETAYSRSVNDES